MRRIAISLCQNKVGRTTTALNLAAGLARKNLRVLLVEADIKSQASFMLGLWPQIGLAELISGEIGSKEALVLARDCLWLLPGGQKLAKTERHIENRLLANEMVLLETLGTLDQDFDYIILDTPGIWGPLTINVLFYAHELLVPINMQTSALYRMLEFEKYITKIRESRAKISIKYVLPMFLDSKVQKSLEIIEQLASYYGSELCPPIRYSESLCEAPAYGQTIFEYAPYSTGAQDYERLIQQVLKNTCH